MPYVPTMFSGVNRKLPPDQRENRCFDSRPDRVGATITNLWVEGRSFLTLSRGLPGRVLGIVKREWVVRHPSFFMILWDPPNGRGATRFASLRRKHDALGRKAKSSCGNVEYGIGRIGRQLAVGDPVEKQFPALPTGPLNRVLLRVAVQEHVQFRHFGIQRPSTSRSSSIVSFIATAYHPRCGAVAGHLAGAYGRVPDGDLQPAVAAHFPVSPFSRPSTRCR